VAPYRLRRQLHRLNFGFGVTQERELVGVLLGSLFSGVKVRSSL
jgi:hypothetical protein